MKSKLILLLWLSTPIILFGAPPTISPRLEKSTYGPKLLFRTLGVDVNESDIFYIDKDQPKPCTIDSERRSQYFEYSSLGVPLSFVRLVKTPEGEEQRIPIAQSQIDPSLRRALLVFSRSDASSEKLKVMVLEEDMSAIPPGGYRVINFLPVAIEVAAGVSKKTVPPNGVAELAPQPAPQMSVYEFRVYGIHPQTNALVPFYSNVYSPDNKVRYLVLVLQSPSSPSQVEVKMLGESVNAIRPDDPEPQPTAPTATSP